MALSQVESEIEKANWQIVALNKEIKEKEDKLSELSAAVEELEKKREMEQAEARVRKPCYNSQLSKHITVNITL